MVDMTYLLNAEQEHEQEWGCLPLKERIAHLERENTALRKRLELAEVVCQLMETWFNAPPAESYWWEYLSDEMHTALFKWRKEQMT